MSAGPYRRPRTNHCDHEDTALDVAALATVYDRLQPWNFSHGFLSRMPEHLVVTRAGDVGWSDWGTPEAIERSLAAIGVVPHVAGTRRRRVRQ